MEWTAIATFVLAFIAAASIVTTFIIRAKDIYKNRSIRTEEINRDFRSQSINGIIEWALELTNPRFKLPVVITEVKPWILIPELEQLATRNIWVKEVAKSFEKRFQNEIEKSTEYLNAYVSTLKKWGQEELLYREVSEAHSALEASIKDVLEDAFKIKAREKL